MNQAHPSNATGDDPNRHFRAHTPDVLDTFLQLNRQVFGDSPDRVVPRKYRELAAVAVALTTQCTTCLDAHSAAARAAGATERELAEITWVASAVRAGGGFTHGRDMIR